jgi:hypothetical protein
VPEGRTSQSAPAFVVFSTAPAPPTAYPVEASTGNWTEQRTLLVPEVWGTQLPPPFVVFRIVSLIPPTMYPVRASTGKCTQRSPPVVIEVWGTQFAPPFVVFSTVPDNPTAYPVTPSSGKLRDQSALVVPEVWRNQPAETRQGKTNSPADKNARPFLTRPPLLRTPPVCPPAILYNVLYHLAYRSVNGFIRALIIKENIIVRHSISDPDIRLALLAHK